MSRGVNIISNLSPWLFALSVRRASICAASVYSFLCLLILRPKLPCYQLQYYIWRDKCSAAMVCIEFLYQFLNMETGRVDTGGKRRT